MDASTWIFFVSGLVLLVAGAESLVRGAARLARGLGVSPVVIGLTVVAYGTSAPEMAVSVGAALDGGQGASLALGNVVGSNIFNVLVILGLSAAISPLVVHPQIVRIDVPLMIGASLLTGALCLNGSLSRSEGGLLALGALAYTAFQVVQSRRESPDVKQEYETELGVSAPAGATGWATSALLVAGGLGLLVLGARWLVASAVAIAQALGVSDLVIGLTIVAAGTSLPEVATSVLATLRGERDIAIGNVIGSSLFNLLAVLGVSALVSPTGIAVATAALTFDLPVMIAVAVACLPIFLADHRIERWAGLLFLAYYGIYTTFLVLDARQHEALPELRQAMLTFVLPLTAITLVAVMLRTRRRAGPGRAG